MSNLISNNRNWLELQNKADENTKKLNRDYFPSAVLLIPGIELLVHIHPKSYNEASKSTLHSDITNNKFVHYSSKKFAPGDIYGSNIFIKPNNMNLLLAYGITVDDNAFETVAVQVNNALGRFNKELKEMSKFIRYWEDVPADSDPIKEKSLRYQLTTEGINQRLLSYFRYII